MSLSRSYEHLFYSIQSENEAVKRAFIALRYRFKLYEVAFLMGMEPQHLMSVMNGRVKPSRRLCVCAVALSLMTTRQVKSIRRQLLGLPPRHRRPHRRTKVELDWQI